MYTLIYVCILENQLDFINTTPKQPTNLDVSSSGRGMLFEGLTNPCYMVYTDSSCRATSKQVLEVAFHCT